jgi:hypothetical protein
MMFRMFVMVLLLAVPVLAIADDADRQAPAEAAEMESIFNGRDLTGWDGDPRLWSVRDGVIHGETTKENAAAGNTFLIYQGGELADFELRLSFRCSATNNSGIQYRSALRTDGRATQNKWRIRGYQHEIRNEDQLPNVPGFIYDEGGKRGRICLVGEQAVWNADGKSVIRDDLINQEGFEKLMQVDQWNDVVIVARGNQIRHFLNGRLILDLTDNHPELALHKGLLALQLHAGAPMWAEFKDIRVRSIE